MPQLYIQDKYPDYADDFQEFLADNDIVHFRWHEVLNCHSDGQFKEYEGVLNDEMPSRKWWPRIIPALKLIEEFRVSTENRGLPITVNSAWRCPKYNNAVGGSLTSNHKKLKALDFDPACELDVMWNWLKKHTDSIGRRYELKKYNTFIHVGARW